MTAAPEADSQTETLTDIYDRLRKVRRGRRGGALGALVVAVVALAGCGGPASDPIPVRVCGTVTVNSVPVRVADEQCTTGGPAVRWYEADPYCLEADDRTDIGEPLNDDYLGEACDPKPKPAVRAPLPTTVARSSTPPTSRSAAPKTAPKPTRAPRTSSQTRS